MAKPKPNPTREKFHRRVDCLWNVLAEADLDTDIDQEVVDILGQLSLGLDALAMGAIPEIFRHGPKEPRLKGSPPSVAREIRWRAVFYVEFLRGHHKQEILASAAVEHVAKAFGVPPSRLTFWRKAIMNKNDKTIWVAKSRQDIKERMHIARSKKIALADVLEGAVIEGKRFKP